MSEPKPCGVCHGLRPVEVMVEFDDALLCPDCLATDTVVCSRCGTRVWADDNAGDEWTHLCQTCYDRYYTTCVRCHRVIHLDDAYYENDDDYDALCYNCFQRRGGKCIHDYYYKPEPVFYGNGERFMGIEPEVDGAGENSDNARRILDIANQSELLVYIKHDGSLDGANFLHNLGK